MEMSARAPDGGSDLYDFNREVVVKCLRCSFNKERVHDKTYAMRDAPRPDVFNYIEAFCNVRRQHSTLG